MTISRFSAFSNLVAIWDNQLEGDEGKFPLKPTRHQFRLGLGFAFDPYVEAILVDEAASNYTVLKLLAQMCRPMVDRARPVYRRAPLQVNHRTLMIC